ncbi:SUMF1/EgtB/PvdO family nonheme iron enzyme [Pendulispora albinea]|uniref:Formylglycine-generating enzyme family protein n=1 Tax=Pendulispora albinea TaxID=2741071 RepID=A0ABZ2M1N8_9BACT
MAAAIASASCQRAPPQGDLAPPSRDARDPAGTSLDIAAPDRSRTSADASAPEDASASDASGADASGAAEAPGLAPSDPMSSHKETKAELLALIDLGAPGDLGDGAPSAASAASAPRSAREKSQRARAERFLEKVLGTGGPHRMNQGNKAIASHLVTREKCLEGLRGITLQTAEQRATCGAENMVPVWSKGKAPAFCIDIFEFPNKACELPLVWTPPSEAKQVCAQQGKRLCSDLEWNTACRGDPEGGADLRYAYGSQLDLAICNTAKGHIRTCIARDAESAWKTCATETEPSGSYPRCRSRFGVFDQHGNVAEIMTRRQGDDIVTQLKGSAWFYDELAKEPNAPAPDTTPNKKGAYPDHCNFDPRWHVEPLDRAHHTNYHLGFRCCKSIP